MPSHVVLAVGHGSRIPQAVAQFNEFAAALAGSTEQPVQSCFLELADPDLAGGLSLAAAQAGPGGEILVLPVFLGAAGHHKNDVASAVQWARTQFPRVSIRCAAPLGIHAGLVSLLDLRVSEAIDAAPERLALAETSLLLVGRGSSDPAANSEIARLAYLLGDGRPYRSVEWAFQAVAHPTLEEGLDRCHRMGASQVVVARFLLFTGRVNDDVSAVTDRAGAALGLKILHVPYLGNHPLLVDVARQRLQEALEDRAVVSCDLCKYRFAMAGHEVEVGAPQVTHHLHGGATPHDHEHPHNQGQIDALN